MLFPEDRQRLLTLLRDAGTPDHAAALAALREVQALVEGSERSWPQLIPETFVFDLDNMPPLLRESDIVRNKDRGYFCRRGAVPYLCERRRLNARCTGSR